MAAEQSRKLRLAVLVSGGGTNLQALIDRAKSGDLSAEIVVVASDRKDALGLVRARKAGIATHVVNYGAHLQSGGEDLGKQPFPVDLRQLDRVQKILKHEDDSTRILHLGRLVLAEQELIEKLSPYQPDFICLAGYMRLVSPYFLAHYNVAGGMRVLNIHPALLPAFPGQHGYSDTLAYGCKWGGITVHFVDEGEDTGPIIAQAVYPVWPDDDLEQVRQRGLQLEYEVYSQCINWLAAGQVRLIESSEKRLITTIDDPSYPAIVNSWLQKSFM